MNDSEDQTGELATKRWMRLIERIASEVVIEKHARLLSTAREGWQLALLFGIVLTSNLFDRHEAEETDLLWPVMSAVMTTHAGFHYARLWWGAFKTKVKKG